ncbi:Bacterial protein of unknown function (DUF885) [Seminavis robusta]|uniref:DUF885 domain-containing protein n=1 Tax=Seminavis robusta TaxID=568900 RepID=A0A9N8EXR4_9STRA|nr:Bacterial protein of unknown function (DUF885) [Seminavis robusta]|eukprot:Sro2739_g335990.1 Bacterial protein of unknown function (DUF885) (631) ;mRNA; f:2044-3936
MLSAASSESLRKELEATWQWRIDTDPELAAALGFLSQRRSTHSLDPRSLESFRQREAWLRQALQRLETHVNRDELANDQEKLSYDLYQKQLADYVTFTPKHKAYLCCVNRLEGPQTDLPLYARYLPVKTTAQRRFYKSFLQAIPKQLEEVMDLLRNGLLENRTPAKISLEGVVEQVRSMVDSGLTAFSDPFQDAFPQEEKDQETECMGLVNGAVQEAFTKFADFLENDYIPNLREEISATKGYPDGAQYYADCLEFHTTTNLTPEQVHQLGLDEVARVRTAMESIASKDGFDGKLDDYLEHLRVTQDYTPQSPQALLAHFRNLVGVIAPAMLKLFHVTTLPRMPLSIVETPPASAPMAPAAYYLAGSSDRAAPRPGTFYVNTSELETRRTYECEALTLHEATPGHHTQAAIQGEADIPDFRRYQEDRRYFEAPCRFPFYTGYIEGWGLHCETLGEELGLYQRPSDRMGQLSMEALRSCRLVVDTGMHALGWTKDQALKFMLQNTAMGEHDAAQETARYITWPGQATAYKVGERFLFRLRSKAEAELGDKFDPRDYYDVVLTCGAVPLDTLEALVDQYIEQTKQGKQQESAKQASNEATTTGMSADAGFLESMTFANWCKCCVVPGSCQTA